MKRLIITFCFLLSITSSFSQKKSKWVHNFITNSIDLGDDIKTSKTIRKKLIDAFQTSSFESKKVLRKLDISFDDINKITKRYTLNELEEVVTLLEGLSPNATRLFISDLARYSGAKQMKNLIKVVKKDKRVLKSYERVSKHMGVKFRTNPGVLLQIADKKRPIKLSTKMTANRKEMYVKKTFSVSGLIFEGYFPDFKKYTSFSTILPKQLIISNDTDQMKYATRQLWKQLQKDPTQKAKYTPEQLTAIKNAKRKIPDYTWHHMESPVGEMALVEEGIHNKLAHDGGNTFWGAGLR